MKGRAVYVTGNVKARNIRLARTVARQCVRAPQNSISASPAAGSTAYNAARGIAAAAGRHWRARTRAQATGARSRAS
jgi:hypothetical protein